MDLLHDPQTLATLNAADIRQRMFTKAADLPAGVARLPIKTIHLNKSPMVMANLKVLTPAMAQRWGIDVDAQLHHAALARELPDMSAIWRAVYKQEPDASPTDVDSALYDRFVGDADRRRLDALRALSGTEVAQARPNFDDIRLPELLFRYRARNFADSLSDDEVQRWDVHRAARLIKGEGGVRSMAQLNGEIASLMLTASDQEKSILMALGDYADAIVPRRGR